MSYSRYTEPTAHLEGDVENSSHAARGQTAAGTDNEWIRLSRQAFEASTSYLQANLRRQWERNISNFRSEHPSGSKYHSQAYKHRSRLFRPKTRSAIRSNEAALASAYFSTADVLNIQPEDDSNPEQLIAAKVMNELMNYRLTHTVPWFQTAMGAFQDAEVLGVVCSHQYWCYEERKKVERIQRADELTGTPLFDEQMEPIMDTVTSYEVLKDTPCVELIPIENLRISPAADWLDPVNTSPYLIHLIPMYVCDVLEIMSSGENPKTGHPPWKKLSRKDLFSGEKQIYDSTRQAREGNRTDSKDDLHGDPDDYDIVWIHRNIFRREGRDWLFYTVGTHILLSDPVPLESAYPYADRERPYTIGQCIIEAHRPYPAGIAELVQQLQAHANDIANQRNDNVRLAMNKRYFVREGGNVDVRSLLRNVPGGVTRMNNVEDVKVIETNDVTGSAYQEQDRINVDFDELAGQFSTSSVQSNRSLNETVGGMQLMQSGTGQLTEYLVRTFTETWTEPVLRQLVRMEALYETDETLLATIGNKLQLEQIDERIFDYELDVSINVGMGATDPNQKVERFSMGLQTVAQVMPDIPARLNYEEVVKEVFGQLGYQDGKRFFMQLEPVDPNNNPELQAEMQKQEAEMQAKQAELDMKREAQQAEIELKREAQEAELELERERLAFEQRLAMERLQVDSALKAEAQKQKRELSEPII